MYTVFQLITLLLATNISSPLTKDWGRSESQANQAYFIRRASNCLAPALEKSPQAWNSLLLSDSHGNHDLVVYRESNKKQGVADLLRFPWAGLKVHAAFSMHMTTLQGGLCPSRPQHAGWAGPSASQEPPWGRGQRCLPWKAGRNSLAGRSGNSVEGKGTYMYVPARSWGASKDKENTTSPTAGIHNFTTDLQSIKTQLCARRAGRAKPEVGEQRSREITSWIQTPITGPFTAVTLSGSLHPALLCPHTLASPTLPIIFKVRNTFHGDLAQVCQEKQIWARTT